MSITKYESMRSTSVATISLPATLAKTFDRLAKRQHMTRSELYRTALRRYVEEHDALAAVAVYEQESVGGKLKVLKGSLAGLV